MKVIDLINDHQRTPFSFEVLPPLKGTGTDVLFRSIERLAEFQPKYINITTHRSEYVYHEVEGGLMQRQRLRRRPGTIAVSAAIRQRFGVKVVPHLVCSGFTREDLEYQLIDLQLLGIDELLIMRGDKARDEQRFQPTGDGPAHATELIEQVNRFNEGFFWDGSPIKQPGKGFHYAVACYPEKHEEAANLKADMEYLKMKQDLGAQYAVTQMFFDNDTFYRFRDKAREMGITLPLIPGIKPLGKLSQLSVVPKTFHCDLPEAFYAEARKCRTDEELRQVGIEWSTEQCRDLLKNGGVPSLHFFTVGAVDSVCEIAKRIY